MKKTLPLQLKKFNFSPNDIFIALVALLAFSFSGCEQHYTEIPEPANLCTTSATVEEHSCWNGCLGTKWLRLDNGELLMPVKTSVEMPALTNGQRITIGYRTLEVKPIFVTVCNVMHAHLEVPDQAVEITCAEPIGWCGTVGG